MENIISTNINVLNKKLLNFSQRNNKSSSETNKSTISALIKNSEDNINGKKFYHRIIHTILFSKYNTLPHDHDMILLENVLQSKYCHDLAVFKEKILFNYNEEFLKRFYMEEESQIRIPKFVTYYKNYLMFFCKPIFSELNLNDLFQDYSEKKAQIFYNNNYKDDLPIEEKSDFPLFTIFTPKIKKLISNNNSLSNLTINLPSVNNTTTSSVEISLIKIINDLTLKKVPKKKKINSNFKLNKKENNKVIIKEKISKNAKSPNLDDIKQDNIGKNLFFIYNKNFQHKKINHKHTKTGTNLNFNQFKEKVLSERRNSKQSFSRVSFSKNKVPENHKKSRNLIINNPLFSDFGVYTYRNENNNKAKLSMNSIHNTLNSMLNSGKKQELRCMTERNNKNLIKAIKQVENTQNKKYKNLSRNLNRNNLSNYRPFASMILNEKKNSIINFNDFVLKTDYGKNMKVRHNSNNQKVKINNRIISNRGISQIKQIIQSQKKKIKK